jgi:hypothetical protein
VGTHAISAPWAESFRYVLLLPSPAIANHGASRLIFESALERVRRSFNLQVYGYVVMPEHVHLLLSEPREDGEWGASAPLKPKDGLNGPPAYSNQGLMKDSHVRRWTCY